MASPWHFLCMALYSRDYGSVTMLYVAHELETQLSWQVCWQVGVSIVHREGPSLGQFVVGGWNGWSRLAR